MWFLPYDFDINNFTNIKFGGEKFCKETLINVSLAKIFRK